MRLIDADVLKIAFCNHCDGDEPCTGPCVDIGLIETAPTIDTVPKWIPCSERLPGSYGKYIVTSGNSVSAVVHMLCYGETMYENDNPCWYFYDSEYGYVTVDDVIAWMPLPMPYKTDGKEKEDGRV